MYVSDRRDRPEISIPIHFTFGIGIPFRVPARVHQPVPIPFLIPFYFWFRFPTARNKLKSESKQKINRFNTLIALHVHTENLAKNKKEKFLDEFDQKVERY